MVWNTVTLTHPATGQTIHDSLTGVFTGAAAELTASDTRLTNAGPLLAFTKNPTSTSAASVVPDPRQALAGLLSQNVSLLNVHPFQKNIGQDDQYNTYLTAPDAVSHIAAKLGDAVDSVQATAGVFCVFQAASLTGLAGSIQQFTNTFPVVELQMIARRCDHIQNMVANREAQPTPAKNPYWKTKPSRFLSGLGSLRSALGDEVSIIESYGSEETSPVNDLVALITKKQIHHDTIQADYTALAESFATGTTTGIYLEAASASALGAALAAEAELERRWTMSAAICFVGSVDEVKVFKELLSL